MDQSGLPIIFIHRAPTLQLSLYTAVVQARLTNERSPVYLISNLKERVTTGIPWVDEWIEHVDLYDYMHEANRFAEVYFNLSSNAEYFERFCFQRWFVLREFLYRRGLTQCLSCDSDVLVFEDISKLHAEYLSDCAFTISSRHTWGISFFNRVDVLNHFCAMQTEVFTRATPLWTRVAEMTNLSRPNVKVIPLSDMTTVRLFCETTSFDFRDTTEMFGDSTFDPNINMSYPGFVMENNAKKVTWKGSSVFGTLEETGELVRMNVLHFQNGAKPLMISVFSQFVPRWAEQNPEKLGDSAIHVPELKAI